MPAARNGCLDDASTSVLLMASSRGRGLIWPYGSRRGGGGVDDRFAPAALALAPGRTSTHGTARSRAQGNGITSMCWLRLSEISTTDHLDTRLLRLHLASHPSADPDGSTYACSSLRLLDLIPRSSRPRRLPHQTVTRQLAEADQILKLPTFDPPNCKSPTTTLTTLLSDFHDTLRSR